LAAACRRTGFVHAALAVALAAGVAHAGPEVAMREFASSQIKKGVRTLGLGGDGATTGNYALNWRDASTALVDYGGTFFRDTGNDFHFVAVGYTTPRFWKDAALYIIGMAEWASNLKLHLKSPAFPQGADLRGEAADQAIFLKLAKPVGHGVSWAGCSAGSGARSPRSSRRAAVRSATAPRDCRRWVRGSAGMRRASCSSACACF
jgi:hypothetical protein